MRKIFSSQRVETAEGVASLLREAGIEVRLSNGRSYRSRRSGQFSYLEEGSAQAHPTVWVVHADDQARARELLREARLLETTRRDLQNAHYSFAEAVPGGTDTAGNTRNWAWRIRITLLLVIAAIALFITLRHRVAPTAAPVPTPAVQPQPAEAPTPATPPEPEDPSRVRIQPAR